MGLNYCNSTVFRIKNENFKENKKYKDGGWEEFIDFHYGLSYTAIECSIRTKKTFSKFFPLFEKICEKSFFFWKFAPRNKHVNIFK